MKEKSEGKQDRPAATLDDLVALVEKAAHTITQLQSEVAECNKRIEELEQSEAALMKDVEKWREVMQLVRQHRSITISLNRADADVAPPAPSAQPSANPPANTA
jgi:FtsZ-binding cell division protein ZapB